MNEEQRQRYLDNREKRPRYHSSQRVEIVSPNPTSTLDGWQGVVRSVSAVQRADGLVLDYSYRLEMDNLASITVLEQDIKAVEETTQP